MKFFFLLYTTFLGLLGLVLSPLQAAESYLVMEANSARVLLASNSEQKRPVAGLTKIASAKVALDWAKISNTSLTTMVVVPESALTFNGANPMGLRAGDRLSMRDAIYSSMLGSDDMSMHALADQVGRALLVRRQRQGDPQKTFVNEMNQLAKALGMRRTRFSSAHGFELKGRKGYSTAADIARLSVYVMRDTGFTFYVKQKSRKISVVTMAGQRKSYTVGNTNQLLSQMGINGIKTGLNTRSGQCLAVNSHRSPLVTKLDDGRAKIRKRDLVVVVLGSADRFAQTKQLVGQGWSAYEQWGATGYTVSEQKREYLVVPQLK